MFFMFFMFMLIENFQLVLFEAIIYLIIKKNNFFKIFMHTFICVYACNFFCLYLN